MSPSLLDLDERRFPRRLLDAIGFREILEVDRQAGAVAAVYEAGMAFTHSDGAIVQGGIAAAWIDNAMALAVAARERDAMVATLEMKLSWLGAVTIGRHVVRARVLKWGRTVVFLEASLGSEADVLVRASSTGRLLRTRAAEAG